MAYPPVRPEQERGRSPTPASDRYDDIELRRDDERALQRALKAIQKKRRVADLHRQIEVERKALDEGFPLPTITGTIHPGSDTSAAIAPAPKRSGQNGSDSEDDSRLRVKDPKTYEGKNQGELDTFILDCERVFRTLSSFVNYIDQLEKDLPPIPEDMKRFRLMCAFCPEIELAIEQRADISESRESLIPLAINIEGAYKRQRSANPSYAQAASGIRSGGSFKDKGKAKADHKGKQEAKPKERERGFKDTPRSYRADSEEVPMPQGASEEKISFLDAHEFIEVSKPLSNLLVGSKQDKFAGKFTLTVDATEAFENWKDASLRRLC
ncbi:MAG: hypothetical protein M1816_002632 [Peltula sp. TS41687]|nr:MAG: hypothetical protein M1816_002632 [Peltula sp. TS41687]